MIASQGNVQQQIAFAIMVKTPGLSSIKTRLAKKIGTERSLQFYLCAVNALQNTVNQLTRDLALAHGIQVVPYWAIAETQAMAAPLWQNWQRECQGEGELGAKLHTIHSVLQKRHGKVIIIGSDLPHLDLDNLTKAVLTLCNSSDRHSLGNPKNAFVLGPTDDGGYYLVGSSQPLRSDVWTSVPYSCADTFGCFWANLSKIAPVSLLPQSYDIDEQADLDKLHVQFQTKQMPATCYNSFKHFFASK